MTGFYVMDNKSVTVPGTPVISVYGSCTQVGAICERDSGGRLSYRARLGWAGGPDNAFSITGFMNFIPHQNSGAGEFPQNTNVGTLPPLCFLQGNPACASFGPQFAQYTQQYPTLSNYVPGMYTFDLAVQYQTGDVPANAYLKHIGLTMSVTDLFNRAPPFLYSVATGSNTPHPFSNIISADQRYFTFTVTKVW